MGSSAFNRLSILGSILILLLFLTVSDAIHAEYFRCLDSAGEVVYSETSCDDELALVAPSLAVEKKSEPVIFSLDQAIVALGQYRLLLLLWFLLPPSLVVVLMLGAHRHIRLPVWKAWLCSMLIYMVTIPGMLSVSLIAYSLFFIQQNLLQVDLFSYFLPPVSMFVTLVLIGRKTSIKRLPGMDNMIGLMIILGIVFLILLLLLKTRIWIAFVGPLQTLLIVGFVLFFTLRWGLKKLTK